MVEMDELLDLVVTEGCSDLHLEVGVAPVIRLHGEMTQLDLPVLTPEDTEALVKSIASPRHLQQLQRVQAERLHRRRAAPDPERDDAA